MEYFAPNTFNSNTLIKVKQIYTEPCSLTEPNYFFPGFLGFGFKCSNDGLS